MCKQKLSIGLLVCSLYAVQAYGMQGSLENLRDRLVVLRDVLQGPPSPAPTPTPKPLVQPVVVPPAPPFVQPVAPTPPPAPVPFVPTSKPLQTVQPNVPVQPLQPKPAPVTPTPAGPGALSAADLARQKEDRERRAAAAAVAGKKKQQAGQSIVEGFITPAFTAYPVLATVPTRLAAKDFPVEKEPVTAIGIKSNEMINRLKGNLFTQEDKKEKKPLAKKMLNGLLLFTKNNVIQPEQIRQIADLVVFILNIDPLLITTADVVLHDLGFDDVAVHRLMGEFFEERIRFIQATLEELKKQVTEGAIQDIDEAFAYSIALSAELVRQESAMLSEKTTPAQKQEAQRFIDKIKELRTRLCAVITDPKNEVLFAKKPGWFAGYLNICGKQQKRKLRVYCVSAEHTYGELLTGKEYEKCLLNVEIPNIIKDIEDYKKKEKEGTMSPSQRLDTVQTIINSLVDINTFFMNPDVCPKCLLRAIGRPEGTSTGGVREPFSPELDYIVKFLKEINLRENSFYITEFINVAIPKMNQTLQQAVFLPWDDADIIYNLIQINRDRKKQGLAPVSLQDVKQHGYPRW